MFRTAIRFVAQVANLPIVKVPLAMACITAGVAVLTRHAGELRDDIDQLTGQRAHLRGEIVHLRARVVAEYLKQGTSPSEPDTAAATYAHNAYCSTDHEAGPEDCPDPGADDEAEAIIGRLTADV